MDKDCELQQLTYQLQKTNLNNNGPRKSERKKRVRFLENTIPWSAYQEMHYTKLLGKTCWNTNVCRRKTCKAQEKVDQQKKVQRHQNERKMLKRRATKCLRKATLRKRTKRQTKMKLPVRNIRKFDMSVTDLKKLLGSDWVYCCTADTGTQVRICGLISVHHRKKNCKKFNRTKCGRCWKSQQHHHDHRQQYKSGGHWLRMKLQYVRENTDSQIFK